MKEAYRSVNGEKQKNEVIEEMQMNKINEENTIMKNSLEYLDNKRKRKRKNLDAELVLQETKKLPLRKENFKLVINLNETPSPKVVENKNTTDKIENSDKNILKIIYHPDPIEIINLIDSDDYSENLKEDSKSFNTITNNNFENINQMSQFKNKNKFNEKTKFDDSSLSKSKTCSKPIAKLTSPIISKLTITKNKHPTKSKYLSKSKEKSKSCLKKEKVK